MSYNMGPVLYIFVSNL